MKEHITSVKTWFEKGVKSEEFFAYTFKDDHDNLVKVYLACVIGRREGKLVRFESRTELEEGVKPACKIMFSLNGENFRCFLTLLKDYCARGGVDDVVLEAVPSLSYETLGKLVVARDFWHCSNVKPLHERREDKAVVYSCIGIRDDVQCLFLFKQPGDVGRIVLAREYNKYSPVACIRLSNQQVDNMLPSMPVLTEFMRGGGIGGAATIDGDSNNGMKTCVKWGVALYKIFR